LEIRIDTYFDRITGNFTRLVYLKNRSGVIAYTYKLIYDCENVLEITSKRKVVIRHTPYRDIIKTVHRWYIKEFEEAEEGEWIENENN